MFARGLSIGPDVSPWLSDRVRPLWLKYGEALEKFSTRLVNDPRVEVLMLPVFDGVTQIRLADPKI